MGSVRQPRVFDPLDLEIIDRVYDAAWAQLQAREPTRDTEKDEDRQAALRKLIFELARSGPVTFDDLFEKVVANLNRGTGASLRG